MPLLMMSNLVKHYAEAHKFIPERWIKDDPLYNSHSSVTMPFGFGPRMCIGRRFAELQMETLLTKVSSLFELYIVKLILCVLCTMCTRRTHIGLDMYVCPSVPMIQLEKRCSDLDGIWYGPYATVGCHKPYFLTSYERQHQHGGRTYFWNGIDTSATYYRII
jgi:hypothetical protein